tara:strand:- start:245 stop:460 length:216 start_codon:yes stop_codon:yes gene_type:complete
MNKRIKDIIGQNCVGEYYAGILCWRFSESQLEKFAELMVKECAEWIKNTDSNEEVGEENAAALLNHFGVKE